VSIVTTHQVLLKDLKQHVKEKKLIMECVVLVVYQLIYVILNTNANFNTDIVINQFVSNIKPSQNAKKESKKVNVLLPFVAVLEEYAKRTNVEQKKLSCKRQGKLACQPTTRITKHTKCTNNKTSRCNTRRCCLIQTTCVGKKCASTQLSCNVQKKMQKCFS